jgi:hypothetical protein
MAMDKPTPIRVLYTAALEGRLSLLPRLFTRIKQERTGTAIPTLLVDLGRACAAGTWLCNATEGRGMLVAMDAMGYDAFHIGGLDPLYSQPALVQQLRRSITTPLAAGPWTGNITRLGLTFVLANATALAALAEPADLTLGLHLSHEMRIQPLCEDQRRVLWLDSGLPTTSPAFGRVDVTLHPGAPLVEVTNHRLLNIPEDTLPDPTIAGVIEFVESEARYALKKRAML